jgi:hypothetical protein
MINILSECLKSLHIEIAQRSSFESRVQCPSFILPRANHWRISLSTKPDRSSLHKWNWSWRKQTGILWIMSNQKTSCCVPNAQKFQRHPSQQRIYTDICMLFIPWWQGYVQSWFLNYFKLVFRVSEKIVRDRLFIKRLTLYNFSYILCLSCIYYKTNLKNSLLYCADS